MTRRRIVLAVALALLACGVHPPAAVAGALSPETPTASATRLLLYLFTWFLPLGVALVAVGMSDPARQRYVATSLPLALAMALLGYYGCGYAFQYGGVGLTTNSPGLEALVAEWSPLDPNLGDGWGLIGLRGFALPPELVTEEGLELFISQLALVTTATLIPLVALRGRRPLLLTLLLALLVSAVCYPLMGNWVRGGGWLAQLGRTLGLGHGFVDYGLSSLHLVGAGAALAGLLAFRRLNADAAQQRNPELPPTHLPLSVLTGAFLALMGWLAMILTQPLIPLLDSPALLIGKALLAIAGSILAATLYAWLTNGGPDAGLIGRGILAALVAVGAGLPFVPVWAAILIGIITGLLLAPTLYLVEHLLDLDDAGAALGVHGIPALLSLIAVGLLADGRQGASWNAPASAAASGAAALGVSGYLLGPSAFGVGSQLYAQLIGGGAIAALAVFIPGAVLFLLAHSYAVPAAVHARARQRAIQLRQKREARDLAKRLGKRRSLRQRAQELYLRIVASSPRRLGQRRRLASQAPSLPLPSHRIAVPGGKRPPLARRPRSAR